MRLVKIEECSYAKFEAIRDRIFDVIPWALINQGYSPKKRIAIFNFWDSDYIPDAIRGHIAQPPASRENQKLLNKVLEEIANMELKDEPKIAKVE